MCIAKALDWRGRLLVMGPVLCKTWLAIQKMCLHFEKTIALELNAKPRAHLSHTMQILVVDVMMHQQMLSPSLQKILMQ